MMCRPWGNTLEVTLFIGNTRKMTVQFVDIIGITNTRLRVSNSFMLFDFKQDDGKFV